MSYGSPRRGIHQQSRGATLQMFPIEGKKEEQVKGRDGEGIPYWRLPVL